MSRHLKFSLKIMPFVLGCAIILVLMKLDSFLFPMAHDFEFISIERKVNTLSVSGQYTLGRECVVIGGAFWAESETGRKHIEDSSIYQYPKKIKVGQIYFGQWELKYPPDADYKKIHYELQYKCHPFWINNFDMFKFDAPQPLYKKGVFFGEELHTNLIFK